MHICGVVHRLKNVIHRLYNKGYGDFSAIIGKIETQKNPSPLYRDGLRCVRVLGSINRRNNKRKRRNHLLDATTALLKRGAASCR